jgi:hypothetical protein
MAGERAGGSGVGPAAARLARQHISRPIRDRMAYIMMHAELTGVVCSGPRVGRQFTHALLDERVPPVRLVAREEALAPRVEKVINSRLSAFGEYAYFRDRFAGVANRNSGSAGLAMTLVSGGRQKLTADLGVGYLNEDRLAGADVSSATWGTGAIYVLKLSDTSEISDDLGTVGTIDNADDWRLDHTIALTAKLTSIVSLKVSNAVRFSNFPAPGFKRTDTVTSVALVASFKRQ